MQGEAESVIVTYQCKFDQLFVKLVKRAVVRHSALMYKNNSVATNAFLASANNL